MQSDNSVIIFLCQLTFFPDYLVLVSVNRWLSLIGVNCWLSLQNYSEEPAVELVTLNEILEVRWFCYVEILGIFSYSDLIIAY